MHSMLPSRAVESPTVCLARGLEEPHVDDVKVVVGTVDDGSVSLVPDHAETLWQP